MRKRISLQEAIEIAKHRFLQAYMKEGVTDNDLDRIREEIVKEVDLEF